MVDGKEVCSGEVIVKSANHIASPKLWRRYKNVVTRPRFFLFAGGSGFKTSTDTIDTDTTDTDRYLENGSMDIIDTSTLTPTIRWREIELPKVTSHVEASVKPLKYIW